MSEERKKREISAVNQPSIATKTTSTSTKHSETSSTDTGDKTNKPHLGLLILESFGSSLPAVNPDKVLLEYTKDLVCRAKLSFSVITFQLSLTFDLHKYVWKS
jgi:hypothetical protein